MKYGFLAVKERAFAHKNRSILLFLGEPLLRIQQEQQGQRRSEEGWHN